MYIYIYVYVYIYIYIQTYRCVFERIIKKDLDSALEGCDFFAFEDQGPQPRRLPGPLVYIDLMGFNGDLTGYNGIMSGWW